MSPARRCSTVLTLAATAWVVAASNALAASQPEALALRSGEAEHYAAEAGVSEGEAAKRLAWQDGAPVLRAKAEKALGADFGGVWIDTTTGRVKLGLADNSAARQSAANAAASQAGIGDGTDTVAVKNSAEDLEAASQWLAAGLERINSGAGATLAAGERTDANVVELQLPAAGQLSSEQDAFVQEARQRLGPLRGGIGIFDRFACTGAFIGRSRSDGALFQFTAGHCNDPGGSRVWSTRFAAGSQHQIGGMHNAIWGSQGDAGIVRVSNPSGWTPRAWVFVTSGPDTTRNESYSIRNDAGSVTGMRVCTTGASYGRSDCGTVTQPSVTLTYDGRTVPGLVRASFCGVQGDSGSPMYAGGTAYGMQVSGFSQCDSVYEPIQRAENTMNVNVSYDAP